MTEGEWNLSGSFFTSLQRNAYPKYLFFFTFSPDYSTVTQKNTDFQDMSPLKVLRNVQEAMPYNFSVTGSYFQWALVFKNNNPASGAWMTEVWELL